MNEKPILFSAPMVRALLREGNPKTQTRRIVKPRPPAWANSVEIVGPWAHFNGEHPKGRCGDKNCACIGEETGGPSMWTVKNKIGVSGNSLWVKETFAPSDSADVGPVIVYRAGGSMIHGATGSKRDGTWKDEIIPYEGGEVAEPERWKPSIFMPRWASRITLEITGVRVERLSAISAADCIAEGIEPLSPSPIPGITVFRDYLTDLQTLGLSARKSYETLWESINGPGSWKLNPWVWVPEFRRVGREEETA